MANQIERDVYVTHEPLKNPISYVRGTDAIPIVFHFRDYDIPSGASVSVFVAKPSGKAVYNSATISGNDVTVTVDSQMFMELGTSEMQVSISQGGKELVQFAQPVNVKANLKAGDFPDSSTSSSFLDDMIAQAQEAVNNANIAAQQAQTAVQNANLAVSNANDAVDSVNAMISSMGANFSSLAQSTNITQLQTTSKNLVGAINELNSKTLKNGVENQNASKTYKLFSGCSYLLTYVGIGGGNINASTLNVGLISTGANASAKSLIQWIVKNGQNQSMFEFDETDSSIFRVNVPVSTWIIMSITKL